MLAEHARINEGDEAANVAKSSSNGVGPVLRGRGRPRGRGRGPSMWSRVMATR